MIKFGTPVIDALRLCYVAEPSLLQDLSSFSNKTSRKFGDFTLTRINADRFEFFFIIYLNAEESGKEIGSLKFGRYGAADSLYVYYQVQNEILYDRGLLDQALRFPDLLGLYFNNYTAIDIALDHKKNFSAIIKRMMRNEKITTILNGKAVKDRKQVLQGVSFEYSSTLDRLNHPTITIKQKKAIANKCNGISVQAYDKKAEIDGHSDKQYILDHYGNPKRLYRLEIRLHYQELKDYFALCNVFPMPADLFDADGLHKMYFYHLSAVIRFTKGRRKMDWETLLKCNGRV